MLLRRTPERTSLHILAESQQNSLEYALEEAVWNRPKYFYSLGVAPFLPLSALESKPKGHVAPSSRLSACPTKGNKSTRRNCWDAGHVVTIDIAVFQTLTSAHTIIRKPGLYQNVPCNFSHKTIKTQKMMWWSHSCPGPALTCQSGCQLATACWSNLHPGQLPPASHKAPRRRAFKGRQDGIFEQDDCSLHQFILPGAMDCPFRAIHCVSDPYLEIKSERLSFMFHKHLLHKCHFVA